MYFASVDEWRYVQRGLMPEARRQPVAEELRGWNWDQPPLRPVYEHPLALYEVASQYCPTGRDVFLRRVQGLQVPPTPPMREGSLLHELVGGLIVEAKRLIYLHSAECVPTLERLVEHRLPLVEAGWFAPRGEEALQQKMRLVRAFEVRRIVERVEGVLAQQPHIGADALAMLALPVTVEVRLDGRYLGLSRHLAADAVAFPQMLVFDLKFGPKEPFHRLSTTGYALVLESLFETPVDLGCVVYVQVRGERVLIERDFHVIGDELRQLFIEARDERTRAVAEEWDPGLPTLCPQLCPYFNTCHPTAIQARRSATRRGAANRGL